MIDPNINDWKIFTNLLKDKSDNGTKLRRKIISISHRKALGDTLQELCGMIFNGGYVKGPFNFPKDKLIKKPNDLRLVLSNDKPSATRIIELGLYGKDGGVYMVNNGDGKTGYSKYAEAVHGNRAGVEHNIWYEGVKHVDNANIGTQRQPLWEKNLGGGGIGPNCIGGFMTTQGVCSLAFRGTVPASGGGKRVNRQKINKKKCTRRKIKKKKCTHNKILLKKKKLNKEKIKSTKKNKRKRKKTKAI